MSPKTPLQEKLLAISMKCHEAFSQANSNVLAATQKVCEQLNELALILFKHFETGEG